MAGIIDDIYGASFVSGAVSGDPMDKNGHGTFVAGVVGAVGNNAIGVSGVNQAVSIISCKFMDATGNGWVSDAIQCIDYCISKDAHILQNSWGGVDYSEALQVRPLPHCAPTFYLPMPHCCLPTPVAQWLAAAVVNHLQMLSLSGQVSAHALYMQLTCSCSICQIPEHSTQLDSHTSCSGHLNRSPKTLTTDLYF